MKLSGLDENRNRNLLRILDPDLDLDWGKTKHKSVTMVKGSV